MAALVGTGGCVINREFIINSKDETCWDSNGSKMTAYMEINSEKPNCKTAYQSRIESRSYPQYLKGLIARWLCNLKYRRARRIARKNGAEVGDTAVFPISLAKKMNSNCHIGNHVSIQTDLIDTRCPIFIDDYVIIGQGTEIITGSHNIDSIEFEYKQYGLHINKYAWIPTKVLILPSCKKIGYGAVIGSGSVVVKEVEDMAVVSGNPAKFLRKRENVHSNLIVESLLGGDYKEYKKTWNVKKHPHNKANSRKEIR